MPEIPVQLPKASRCSDTVTRVSDRPSVQDESRTSGLRGRVAAARDELRWRRSPVRKGTEAYVAKHGLDVKRGPFAGLTYPAVPRPSDDLAVSAYLVAKLVGSYEQELHETVETLIARAPKTVVNVGSGDGYYVVGPALRLPEATVYAYDRDPAARRDCTALAQANGVGDRVVQRGEAQPADLDALIGGGGLVILDCEGFEDVLLDPVAVPNLGKADLLVELHDIFVPGLTPRVTERLQETHDLTFVTTGPRYRLDFPELSEPIAGASFFDLETLLLELRPVEMQWLVGTRR